MVIEVAGAIAAGLAAGSFALVVFGSDSVIELISGLAVARHLREDGGSSTALGRKTAQLTTGLLFALIPTIGLGAAYSYFVGIKPEASPLGIAISIGAIIIMAYLWLEKKRIGVETRCLPLSVDAAESTTCFFMSIALLGGLLAEFLLGLWWADYVTTGLILAFVAREGIEAFGAMKGLEGLSTQTAETEQNNAQFRP